MNTIWIIPAVLTFLAGQFYLFRCLGKLDTFLEQNAGEEASCDNRCRYPEEDVVE